jgi:hypothetical protein
VIQARLIEAEGKKNFEQELNEFLKSIYTQQLVDIKYTSDSPQSMWKSALVIYNVPRFE